MLCQCVSVCRCAKRVDANLRARETIKRRRSQEIQRRDETTLNTTELFQLTEGTTDLILLYSSPKHLNENKKKERHIS